MTKPRSNRTVKPPWTSLKPDLYFSYSQFYVHDASVLSRRLDWTKAHSNQGFARREKAVAFGALLEFGMAKIRVAIHPYEPREEYERVIAVPFKVTSGKIIVGSPNETHSARDRNFALPPGNYRLVAAQRVTGDDQAAIDLFFEPLAKPPKRSAILVADAGLHPPARLIEN
jgi:Competence protein J (ComJ)